MTSRALSILDRLNDYGAGLVLGLVLAGLIVSGQPWSVAVAMPATVIQGALIFRARWQRRATLAASQQWREKALKLEEQFLKAKARAELLQDWETGLQNHRQFEAEWQRQVDRSRRSNEPFSLVLLDIRNLKTQAGHLSTPTAKSVAQALAGIVHTDHSVFRLGSARFAVLLVGNHPERAAKFVERARFALSVIRDGEFAGYLRLSSGVSEWRPEIWSLDELVANAEADQHGRLEWAGEAAVAGAS